MGDAIRIQIVDGDGQDVGVSESAASTEIGAMANCTRLGNHLTIRCCFMFVIFTDVGEKFLLRFGDSLFTVSVFQSCPEAIQGTA